MVAACVTLHNLCEKVGDAFLEEWRTEDSNIPQTRSFSLHNSTTTHTPSGQDIRDALAQYFSTL